MADEVAELSDPEAVAAEPVAVGERAEPKPLGLGFRLEQCAGSKRLRPDVEVVEYTP